MTDVLQMYGMCVSSVSRDRSDGRSPGALALGGPYP